jgi:hypothetical protein
MSSAFDKMLYMAALNGAVKKAGDSAHFNLETHIPFPAGRIEASGPVGPAADFAKALSGILQRMQQMSNSVESLR